MVNAFTIKWIFLSDYSSIIRIARKLINLAGWRIWHEKEPPIVIHRLLANVARQPDPKQALADYDALAGNYDGTAARIVRIRRDAVDSLSLKSGDTVIDVAFGTGDTLLMLAERVAPDGRVVGVEQSAAMASIASQKVAASPYAKLIDIRVCAADKVQDIGQCDAMLFSFAHDVLQHPAAVTRLMTAAQCGTRIAVAGLRFVPWWWGWPVNVFNAIRARRYTTSFRGLRAPWKPLLAYTPDLQVKKTYLFGCCYVAAGRVTQLNPFD
jgi:SAM-dependent methyltransferase